VFLKIGIKFFPVPPRSGHKASQMCIKMDVVDLGNVSSHLGSMAKHQLPYDADEYTANLHAEIRFTAFTS